MRNLKSVVLAVAFISLIVNVNGLSGQKASDRKTRVATVADLDSSLEAAARTVGPAVVEIFTTSYVPRDGLVPETSDLVETRRASGSGVIVDPEGYIVTNAHVVQGARRIRVELPMPAIAESTLASGSRNVSARIVGIDAETDLAVIKIDENHLPAIDFADSDELKAGQIVLAFGNPLGLHNSVSMGVVSAVGRQLVPDSPMIYVQTDASINPGSSGGPLTDLRGRLVGINTLIYSAAGGNEGVGFAAPSNIVRIVYEQIKVGGRVRRGDIGIQAQTVTPLLASGLKLSRDHGVILADVAPGSPAAWAGLRPGDLVLTFDGKTMENGRQLQDALYRRAVGDLASIEILRQDEKLNVSVLISERQNPFADLPFSIDPRENMVPRLGILAITLDREIAEMIPALRVQSGVVVVSTAAGAIDTRDGGLAQGDIIYAVNSGRVGKLSELRLALDALQAGDSTVLQIERRGQLMYLAFRVE